jgi:hypothetical protein
LGEPATTPSPLKDFALALEIGVVLIPLYLLLDPWHHGLVRALPIVIPLFLGFSAVAGGLNSRHPWITGLLVATPILGLVGPAAFLISPLQDFVGLDLPLMGVALACSVVGGVVGSAIGRRRNEGVRREESKVKSEK